MNKYSQGLKEEILRKWFSGTYASVNSFALENNVPYSTVDKWIKNAPESKHTLSARRKNLYELLKKQDEIFDWKQLPEKEKGQWLRTKGLTEEQLTVWETEIKEHNEFESINLRKKLYEVEMENSLLRKDLQEKDKALADVSARLILKKKMEEFLMAKGAAS